MIIARRLFGRENCVTSGYSSSIRQSPVCWFVVFCDGQEFEAITDLCGRAMLINRKNDVIYL